MSAIRSFPTRSSRMNGKRIVPPHTQNNPHHETKAASRCCKSVRISGLLAMPFVRLFVRSLVHSFISISLPHKTEESPGCFRPSKGPGTEVVRIRVACLGCCTSLVFLPTLRFSARFPRQRKLYNKNQSSGGYGPGFTPVWVVYVWRK